MRVVLLISGLVMTIKLNNLLPPYLMQSSTCAMCWNTVLGFSMVFFRNLNWILAAHRGPEEAGTT